MITIDQAKFFANLQLTQSYCERELQHKEKADWVILRSLIKPFCKDGQWFVHILSHDMATNGQPISVEAWAQKTDPYHPDSFAEIFDKQLELKAAKADKLSCENKYEGRILVIEYGLNIPDGANEAETDGFFDEWDIPPIDTWFYNDSSITNGGILFAWIPEKFVDLADRAIDIQFLGILKWFDKPSSWDAEL
jgi:hypothetical protein